MHIVIATVGTRGWANTLASLGTSPPPVPRKNLTVERLGDAIARATSEPAFAERAEALGASIRAEDGASMTAERALHHLTHWPPVPSVT